MLRLLGLLGMLMTVAMASAFDYVYQPALAVEGRGDTVALVDGEIDRFKAHIRAQGRQWSVVLGEAQIAVKTANGAFSDVNFDGGAAVSVVVTINDSVVAQKNLGENGSIYGFNSVVIEKFYHEYIVYAGHKRLDEVCRLPIAPEAVALVAAQPAQVCRYMVDYTTFPERPQYQGEMALDMADNDYNEGFWRSLDHDVNDQYATARSLYRLFIERSVEGYDVWDCQSGLLKGRLLKTAFPGHYDLLWYDAEGRVAYGSPHHNSATLTQPGLLELAFPLLKSTMRLAKQEQ